MLYQLSYFRRIRSEEEETRTPTSQLTLPPQSSASTNSATSPLLKIECIRVEAVPFVNTRQSISNFERKTRLELATLTLARLCSTNWAISAWTSEEEETRTPTSQLTLPPQSSASTYSATSPVVCWNLKDSLIVPRTGLEPARPWRH